MNVNLKEMARLLEVQRQWLKPEYKKALIAYKKTDTKENLGLVTELQGRIKSFEREVNKFYELKNKL
jgi:hypothetical protein